MTPITQADIEQASKQHILLSEDQTVLMLYGQEPAWLVVRRDGQLLATPYPMYLDYHRWLEQQHWVCGIQPKGSPWANAFYRRAVRVTWASDGQCIGTPLAIAPCAPPRSSARGLSPLAAGIAVDGCSSPMCAGDSAAPRQGKGELSHGDTPRRKRIWQQNSLRSGMKAKRQ